MIGLRMRSGWLMALAALTALALVAGCGQRAPQQAAPPPEPKVLTIATGTDIENLDVHLVTSSPSFSVLEHIFESLFAMKPDGSIEPLLAESFSVEPDGRTYTIRLKQGISFTDGAPFDANAVKANFERVLNPESKAAYRNLINTVTDIRVVGAHTVQLVTENPFGPMLTHLTHPGLSIISPAVLAQGADALARNPVGTGPFVLKEWKQGEAVILARNADYWGEKARLDEVVFKVVQEDGARLVEVEAGTSDVAVRVPPSEAQRLRANPNIVIDTTPGLRTIFVYFNVTKPPFDDPRVRQAFNFAVDKESIVRDLLLGAARPSDAPIAPPVFGYSAQTPYRRDVARARQLLQDAGYGDGLRVVFYHPTGRYVQDARIADAIRAQLAEVGVTAELRTLEWGQYLEFIRKPLADNEVQMAFLGWGTVTGDADYGLHALFHSSQWAPSFNLGFYKNEQVDALLDEARNVADANRRLALYTQAQRLLWEDAPWLFLHSEVQLTAVRGNVKGFVVHPTERIIARWADKD